MRKIWLLLPLCFCVLFALLVPLFSPYNANLSDLSSVKLAPSLSHFFGTDFLGRDLFTRMAHALRVSLFVGFFTAFLAVFFAMAFILLSRLFFTAFWLRILDAFIAFPSLLLVMFFQSFLQGSLWLMCLVIALGHFMFIAKILDAQIKSLEKLDFYACAIVLGSSKMKALIKDLLPACINLLIVLFILNIAHAISNEATLSFFSLGVPLGEASLGVLLNDGAKGIFIGAWWLIVFPVAFLLLLILPLLSLANSMQDALGVKF